MRTITSVGLFFCVTLVTSPLCAQDKKPPEHTRLSAILGGLQWGESVTAVLANVEKNLENEWKEKLKLLDAIGIDRLKAKVRAKYQKIKRSVVRFNGAQTGFESSILANEMLVGKNESLLRLGAGKQERYYFFRDESLWKIVVVRDATHLKSFPDFLTKLQAALGKANQLDFGTIKGKRSMVGARWRDNTTVVSAEDHRLFYNAFLVRFVQAGVGESYTAERKGRPVAGNPKPKADPVLNDILADGEDSDDDDVVDRMTGKAHDLDLESGRPTYKGPQKVAPIRDDDEDDEDDKDESAKTTAKTPKAAKKKAAPKKRGKPDQKSGIVF